MTRGFIQLYREEAIKLLEAAPKAFLLYTQIALRAKRTDANYSNLKVNQAMIGDYEKIGLTRQEYRNAKERLARHKLATFETSNKGTIATLISTAVYDINAEAFPSEMSEKSSIENDNGKFPKNQQATTQEPSDNHHQTIHEPLTRMKESKNEKMKKNPLPPTFTSKKPENIEIWKKKMIALGWAEEEFDEAWQRYILAPSGSVQNVRNWLPAVLQSIRDEHQKEGHVRKLAHDAELKQSEEKQSILLENEQRAQERIRRIQANKDFMQTAPQDAASKEKYEVHENYIKLLKGDWNGGCLNYDDENFQKFTKDHLGISENGV